MTSHDVLIAGAGPTGLMLAAELALAGVDVAIIERRPNQELVGSRARGLNARTLEVLDQRGVADRFVAEGQKYPAMGFHHVQLDITDFPTRHNYLLGLLQKHVERILADWVTSLPVTWYRAREVVGFTYEDELVRVALSDGTSLRGAYLVGCDGGRSIVRKTAGIEFPGSDATTSWLIAEVELTTEPEWGFRHDARGTHAIGKAEDGKRAALVITEARVGSEGDPTLRDIRNALVAVYGTDFGAHSPTSASRFTDMTRQAAAYRDRRVLLAGDAAHVHAPIGGQGLNLGVQDAVNLGWKLAQVVKETSPDDLLDTYHAERHPVAARVLRNTMAQSALRRPDDHTKALGDYIDEFLRADQTRKQIVAELSGLGVRYDFGEGHPLLGRRMPDLDIVTASGPATVFSLLHEARPALINLGEPGRIGIAPWEDRVQLVDARYDGVWELPAIGVVSAPSAVLVRPDGHVAWAGEWGEAGLATALEKWFGPAKH